MSDICQACSLRLLDRFPAYAACNLIGQNQDTTTHGTIIGATVFLFLKLNLYYTDDIPRLPEQFSLLSISVAANSHRKPMCVK